MYDNAIGGELAGHLTTSPDGSTVTGTWSSPLLAGQNLTFFAVESDGEPSSPAGAAYFTGYTPTVSVTNPGAQKTQVGTPLGTDTCGGTTTSPCCDDEPCSAVALSGTELGIASGDDASNSTGTMPVQQFSATGLPPGLHIVKGDPLDDNPAGIVGRPTTPGAYTVTITGTGSYLNGAQHVSDSTQFTWTITPTPPPPLKLTPQTASAAFMRKVPNGAFVPKQGFPCPEAEIIATGRRAGAECFIEYRQRSRWHQLSGEVKVADNVAVATIDERVSWRRRWVKCSVVGVEQTSAQDRGLYPRNCRKQQRLRNRPAAKRCVLRRRRARSRPSRSTSQAAPDGWLAIHRLRGI